MKSLKYSRKAILKLMEICNVFSNWNLLIGITILWGSEPIRVLDLFLPLIMISAIKAR